VEEGAAIVDVGGESTRPGAASVTVEDELARVIPVIQQIQGRAAISIDTVKAPVARAAVAAGASIINDVSGGRFDPEMILVVEETGAGFVCGHLRGDSLAEAHAAPRPSFDDVAVELAERLALLSADARARTIVDPGIGFGKDAAQNVELLGRAGELGAALARPVMVGPSRKRFLGELTGRQAAERDAATIGACLAAVQAGANVLRVHDVRGMKDALLVFERVTGRSTP
jgi:dihydropteroate synthase